MSEEAADKVVDVLYKLYGSGTGVLFGLPPDKRFVVRAIVVGLLRLEEDGTLKEICEEAGP